METEGICLAQQRIEQKPRDTFPAVSRETLTRQTEILAELSGVLVRIRVVRLVSRQDQTGQHVIQKRR